jgi:hypothetical protein
VMQLGPIGGRDRDRGPDGCPPVPSIPSARLVWLAVIAVRIAVRFNYVVVVDPLVIVPAMVVVVVGIVGAVAVPAAANGGEGKRARQKQKTSESHSAGFLLANSRHAQDIV